MTNSNPIIRPPVLGQPTTSQQAANMEMENMITNIVNRVCNKNCKDIVESMMNPNSDRNRGIDQIIEPEHRNNLNELDKIPDVVRCLRDFSGNPGEFSSWKKSVDRILRIYEPSRGTPKYFGILNVIRNKIIGHADIALESYNTPLNWESISRCLTLHYADKRDLGTLEYQMSSLAQGNCTVEEFYQTVYSHLSLILSKISCMDLNHDTADVLTQTYRDKALDTFIRGLRGELPKLLGMREPADLPQALHLCLKIENQNFRTNYTNSHRPIPPISPRRSFDRNPSNKFYPELAHFPRPFTNYVPRNMGFQNNHRQAPFVQNQFPKQHQFNYSRPSRPFAPKPQPKPEPMEVDTSFQTRAVNYQNRPQFNKFQGKRTLGSNQVNNSNKFQRNFHISSDDLPSESQNYFEMKKQENDKFNTEETDLLTDIHFLG